MGGVLNVSNFNESQQKTWDKINSDPKNWENGKVGASPLLSQIDIYEPEIPKASGVKPSTYYAQKDIVPKFNESPYMDAKLNGNWLASKLPVNKNQKEEDLIRLFWLMGMECSQSIIW